MRTTVFIFILLFSWQVVAAQNAFKTTVPQQAIVVGESFRVQYVLENATRDDLEMSNDPKVFPGFRLVNNGPVLYDGWYEGSKPVVNITYTLVALRPGKVTIPGISVKVNGRLLHSNNVTVEVISRTEAFERSNRSESSSEYFLRPDEDPHEKMRNNLFLKVMVNKRSCYIGEPVVATFKLYSRLQSKSDIVKNPGFYGFSVEDIISLDDHVSDRETINGKMFDVHTIRTVQLYPLQAGLFMIDAMEVLNRVEFSRSIVNKKTEQEISEGVVEKQEQAHSDKNTVSYENTISTETIRIDVKPYPVKNKPEIFNGATGKFSVHAAVDDNKLSKNEEGLLIVTVEGKGNFTQLPAPVVQWPEDMEGFDATVKDVLDKEHSPLAGTRTFYFPFVASKAGDYNIPPVSLAFFDPDSNKYKTVKSASVEIEIENKDSVAVTPIAQEQSKKDSGSPVMIWVVATGVLLAALATLYFIKKRKQVPVLEQVPTKYSAPGINSLLQPAYLALQHDDRNFYSIVQKAIWDHLGDKLNLSGSGMNKHTLQKAMEAHRFSRERSKEILRILEECETAAFTKAELLHDKRELLERLKSVLG